MIGGGDKMNVKIRARRGVLEKLEQTNPRVRVFMDEYRDNVFAWLVYGNAVEIRIGTVFPSMLTEVALAIMAHNRIRVERN
jgi:hypothetical protein